MVLRIKTIIRCENEGKPSGTMDMLIAAHSIAADAVLITNDKAFYNVKHHLTLQDWTKPIAQVLSG